MVRYGIAQPGYAAGVSCFELRLLPLPEMLRQARQDLQAHFERSGLPEEVVYDLLLVASELLTNGVIHDGGQDLVLRVGLEAGSLHLEVASGGGRRDEPGRAARRGATDPVETGRGLSLVGALVDEIHIDASEGGWVTRIRRQLER